MARDLFRAELGLHLTAENSDSGVKVLFGSGAPTMDVFCSRWPPKRAGSPNDSRSLD